MSMKLKQYLVHVSSFYVVATDEDTAWDKAVDYCRTGEAEPCEMEYDGDAENEEVGDD